MLLMLCVLPFYQNSVFHGLWRSLLLIWCCLASSHITSLCPRVVTPGPVYLLSPGQL